MYDILVHTHSILRWAVLLFLVIASLMAVVKWFQKAEWTPALQKMALFSLIFSHLQLVVGLILYFISPRFNFSAAAMKNDVSRYFMVEHSVLMIVAIILITIGYSVSKRRTGLAKVKNLAIYYVIALIIMLIMIPWPWQQYAASYF